MSTIKDTVESDAKHQLYRLDDYNFKDDDNLLVTLQGQCRTTQELCARASFL